MLDYAPTYQDNHDGHGDGKTVNSYNATVANIGYKFNDRFQLTAAYSNSHNDNEYPFELMTFGFNAKLGKDWGLTAEYIKNNNDYVSSDEDDGYWIRATYGKADFNKKGSFSIYAEYLNFEPYAIDGRTYGHVLDVPANNWYNEGAKGYGIGITYVPAKNMNVQFIFHDLKPEIDLGFDVDFRNSYQFVTNFRF